jgi:hypothetical protein
VPTLLNKSDLGFELNPSEKNQQRKSKLIRWSFPTLSIYLEKLVETEQ